MSPTVPITVYIQEDYTLESLPKTNLWETWFQQWVNEITGELPVAEEYELTLCLSDNVAIQTLNAQYRQKNQPTDVLAFASLETPFPHWETFYLEEPLYLGDIIISVETAQQQAPEHDHTLTQELAWLAVHGLLHLAGWDHRDQESLEKMLAHQETLLVKSGHK